MISRFGLSTGFLLLAVLPTFAQGTSAQRAACTPDVFRLCASKIPDVDAIVTCLKQDKAKLSAGCRSVMDAADKPTQSTATRSVNTKTGWCHFDGAEAPDDDWLTWCGKTTADPD